MARGRSFSFGADATMPYQPFIVPSLWQPSGMPLGTCLRTRRRIPLDAYLAQRDGVTKSLEIVFTGLKKSGKTTAMKLFSMATMIQQAIGADGEIEDMRMHIDNRKPEEASAEWAGIVKSMACDVIALRDLSLEMLDPVALKTEWDILQTAMTGAEFIKGEPLSSAEVLAMRIAIFIIKRDRPAQLSTRLLERVTRGLSVDDIDAFYRRVDDHLLVHYRSELNDPESGVLYKSLAAVIQAKPDLDYLVIQAAAFQVATYLTLIFDGMFGRMFAGKQSIRDYLAEPAALFDMSGLSPTEVAFFETQRFNTMTAALNNNDLAAIPHVHIMEEVQEEGQHLLQARAHAFQNAKARASHKMGLSSTQYFPNLMYGESGTELRDYARQIYSGTDMFVIFQQPSDEETWTMMRELELDDSLIRFSQRLGRGCSIIKARERDPLFVQWHIPPMMRELVQSSGATERMLQRRPVMEDPRIRGLMERKEVGGTS
ncbi:MAG TPA: hypothetical protein PKV96_00040 [Candidatus Saccharimonas sp.]|nr:hypothetical protein [Candidatus Saccharimonas sp.]